ncbi:MAG: EamA family transporter [Rhodospirillales bacterium]|nr:MAG: EamA family transporter [Rhodospirillales bacterium]
MTRPSFALGIAFVAGGALCWSFGGLVVRALHANAWEVVFWRSLFMAIVVGGFLYGWRRASTRHGLRAAWRTMALSAACLTVAFVGFILALKETTVANVLVVTSSAPLMAALLARVVLGEPVRWNTWAAMVVALGGVALMVRDSLATHGMAGSILAVICAAGFAANMVVVRTRPDIDMIPTVPLAGLLSAAITLPLAWPFPAPVHEIPWLAFLGVVQLGLGLVLFTLGLRHLPAAQASLVALLETVLGPLWVWLVFAESPGAAGIAGGAMVLGALVANTLVESRAGAAKAAT